MNIQEGICVYPLATEIGVKNKQGEKGDWYDYEIGDTGNLLYFRDFRPRVVCFRKRAEKIAEERREKIKQKERNSINVFDCLPSEEEKEIFVSLKEELKKPAIMKFNEAENRLELFPTEDVPKFGFVILSFFNPEEFVRLLRGAGRLQSLKRDAIWYKHFVIEDFTVFFCILEGK